MLCCGAEKVVSPTPTAPAESPEPEPEKPEPEPEKQAKEAKPKKQFVPNKIDRPESSELKHPIHRPDSANGVRAPLFNKKEEEQLWINERVLELKRELKQMNIEMSEQQILEVARAEISTVRVSRNILTEYDGEDDGEEDSSSEGEFMDTATTEAFASPAALTAIETTKQATGAKPEVPVMRDELEVKIAQQLKEIKEESIARSASEEELAELLGEGSDDMAAKPTKRRDEAVVVGDIILE